MLVTYQAFTLFYQINKCSRISLQERHINEHIGWLDNVQSLIYKAYCFHIVHVEGRSTD